MMPFCAELHMKQWAFLMTAIQPFYQKKYVWPMTMVRKGHDKSTKLESELGELITNEEIEQTHPGQNTERSARSGL